MRIYLKQRSTDYLRIIESFRLLLIWGNFDDCFEIVPLTKKWPGRETNKNKRQQQNVFVENHSETAKIKILLPTYPWWNTTIKFGRNGAGRWPHPSPSSASRIALMRPSCMSDGATMSAPARAWATACLHRGRRPPRTKTRHRAIKGSAPVLIIAPDKKANKNVPIYFTWNDFALVVYCMQVATWWIYSKKMTEIRDWRTFNVWMSSIKLHFRRKQMRKLHLCEPSLYELKACNMNTFQFCISSPHPAPPYHTHPPKWNNPSFLLSK